MLHFEESKYSVSFSQLGFSGASTWALTQEGGEVRNSVSWKEQEKKSSKKKLPDFN
jgi:hypothetical protein